MSKVEQETIKYNVVAQFTAPTKNGDRVFKVNETITEADIEDNGLFHFFRNNGSLLTAEEIKNQK